MRYIIGIEYDGTNYHGWQKQLNLHTVQENVEEALAKVANHAIVVVCAGRTDAGVHAFEQVAHFDSEAKRDLNAWVAGTNSYLPKDIRIHWVREVSQNFSARFSAIARIYRYSIYNHPTPSAILRNQTGWVSIKLDEALMQEAAHYLLGEKDFSSFRGSGCQSKSKFRYVEYIRVTRNQDMIYIDIKANAFLLHMVRNITGLLIDIGIKKHPPLWAKHVLEAYDRTKAPPIAPPQGLCLMQVEYPDVERGKNIRLFYER